MDALDHDEDPELKAAPAVLERFKRALNLCLLSVIVLAAVFFLQMRGLETEALSLRPQDPAGLIGILTAPLLHGSLGHLGANAFGLLMLGTLAGTVFPRATLRALPVIWLGSGLGTWLIATGGSHIGASGVTHGLGFLVFALGLLRRDRAAIAAGMLAFLFYGGMLLTVFPQEAGVSWQSHLGGALGGVVCAFLFRNADPMPPRRKYSWELEEEEAERQALLDAQFEPARPDEVPVLWQHGEHAARDGRNVLPFRRTDD